MLAGRAEVTFSEYCKTLNFVNTIYLSLRMSTLVQVPDIAITRWNRPRDSGDTRWQMADMAPELSPIKVTLSGSPPKLAMFSRIQRRARYWSWRPRLPSSGMGYVPYVS